MTNEPLEEKNLPEEDIETTTSETEASVEVEESTEADEVVTEVSDDVEDSTETDKVVMEASEDVEESTEADEVVTEASVDVEESTEADEDVDDEDEDEDGVDATDEDDYDDDEDDEDDDEASESESTSGLKRGDLVEGTVIKNTPTEVLIDVGADKPGVVNSRELEYLTKSTLDSMEEGASVWVYILSPSSKREGHPVLSIGRAAEERDWIQAQEYYDDKSVYHGKISGYNKGGLIVRFGRLRGFIPASQIATTRRARAEGDTPESRWSDMIDEDISVKVVEIKRSRNRLILSEQAAQSEIRAMEKSKLMEELTVGEVRTGTVTSLTDFGAFVDIGGADGLVHVTEMSWQHVDHPSEMLKVGEEVDVQVISVDEDNNRIGLSMRTLSKDPWQAVEDEYEVGQLIQATITKLTKFGAFARLVDHPDIEGLVHVSELAEHRVKHPREMVNVGDVITLRIVKIDHNQRRLGLSLKRVDSPDYLDVDWKMVEADLDD